MNNKNNLNNNSNNNLNNNNQNRELTYNEVKNMLAQKKMQQNGMQNQIIQYLPINNSLEFGEDKSIDSEKIIQNEQLIK